MSASEAEREPPVKNGRVEPPPEGLVSRARPGVTRCPFCHEACEPDASSCACVDCLARHHQSCWDEGGACSSCRSPRRLVTEGTARTQPPGYGRAMLAWLKLWVVYNSGLSLLTVVRLVFGSGDHSGAFFVIVLGAVVANMCFLLGPAVELPARWLGYRGAGLRSLLFGVGFVIALVLAIGTPLNGGWALF